MKRIHRTINTIIVKCYNHVMGLKVLNINNKYIRRVRAMFYHNICYGCEACFGKKNPDRKFYVIRCPQSTLGFFGLFNYVVYHIKIAEYMGYEPIADWQYYPNSSIMSDKTFTKQNAWNFYFEPMLDVSLEDVYESKNVWMCSGEFNGSLGEAYNEIELLKSKELIEKYMRPNEDIVNRVQKRLQQYNMEEEKVLGVLCRGTDFIATKPKFHSTCPTAEEMIEIIECKMKEWTYYPHIFVATEDKKILSVLKEKYGERLLVNQETMLNYSGKLWLNKIYEELDDDIQVLISKEYFSSILLLSKCDSLIAPLVGGTLGALRIKGKYNNLYIVDKGSY